FFVIIFSFRIILSEKINFKKISNLLSSQKSGIIFGIFSGFLGAIMAIDGPPIIIYLTESIRKKDKLRATLFFTFLLFSFIRLFTFIITGVFTKNTFIFLIQALPFVVLGSITGVKLSKYISEKHFKKIIALLIMITGLFLFF
ncbi:sulfite exporter TauE/SafE family protein, partial [Patescibacteria group bacterium]|nr:sulfite exporter TauE/SafE family protein [Patescibacteria group bacterium]